MTRQITDKLIFENKEYYLNVELIELFFREFPEKRPEFEVQCTALWRGYVATFEIKNNELLIKEINWLTDIDFNIQMNVYPNPSTGALYIVNSSSVKERQAETLCSKNGN